MNTNRRNTPRFSIRIPIKVQRLDLLDPIEHTIVSSNVSAGGVYFSSEVPLTVGTPVRLFLDMPEHISGKPSAKRCYEGRVIHVQLNGESSNDCGVGISFYYVLATLRLEPIGRLSA